MHVWGETDPFRFPPSEFNFGVLQAVEPFLRIHRYPAALNAMKGHEDKFKGGKTKQEALRAALEMISFDLAAYERTYTTERPRHLELIRQVEKFTRPTEQEYASFEEEAVVVDDEADQKGFVIVWVGADENEGEITSAAEGSPSHSSSSEEGDTEAPPQGPGYGVQDRGRTDCRVFVFNEGPRKQTACEVERLRLSPQRCAMVCESTPDENWEALAQAAACGRVEMQRNLSNRHYKPLYLLALSKYKFTYAVMKAEGQMITGGNSVSDNAYEDFVASAAPGSTPASKAVIDKMFQVGSKFLRENYRNKPNARYLKRPYIVGDLYVAPDWYMLPTNEVQGGMFSAEAKKFYEGLLRVVLGDRVLQFSEYHFMAAAGLRMAQSLKQSSRGGGDMSKALMMMNGAQLFAMGSLGGFRVPRPLELPEEGEEEAANKRQRLV